MSRLWRWLGYVLKRKRLGTTRTRNNQGFHVESLPAQSALSTRVLLGGSIFLPASAGHSGIYSWR